jgi:hypothetical protein
VGQTVPPQLLFGLEIRSLQNFGVLNFDAVDISESSGEFDASYRFSGGLGFGGVVRIKLTDFWNIETGIHYVRTRYDLDFNDAVTGLQDESQLNVVTYELPLKGLVYIRLGRQLFSNVALGVSADFIASNVESFGLEGTYSFGAIRRSTARGAVLGSLGFEFRTEEDGYFYLGGSFHQPFGDTMFTQVTYFRDGDPPPFGASGRIDGAYFSIDFRYFLPNKEKQKPKVRYVRPDWKNM